MDYRRIIKRRRWLVLLICALVLAGCGGGGSSAYTDPNTNGNGSTASGVQLVDCTGLTVNDVTISGFLFSPNSLTVSANSVVKWTNNHTVTHSVTSGTGSADGKFTRDLAPGTMVCFKFITSGSYPYFCRFHTGMTGNVSVN